VRPSKRLELMRGHKNYDEVIREIGEMLDAVVPWGTELDNLEYIIGKLDTLTPGRRATIVALIGERYHKNGERR
jgi:hypothetical protein